MSKKKQIEEMVKIIDQAKHDMWVGECPTYAEHSENIAKYLYNAGYRKQEWISVEERLPDKDDIYLVCLSGLPAAFDRFVLCEDEDFKGYFEHSKVTHWMPLPEAPKMKGGAE